MTLTLRSRNTRPFFYIGQRLIPGLAAAVLIFLAGCAGTRNDDRSPLTVQQIVTMSREGVPASAIIAQIRESGTVYRLQASQYAKLKSEGVPDAVLNAMQHTYIRAIRRNQSLRDWDYWSQGPDGYWYGGIPYGWPYDYEFFPEEPFGGGEEFEGGQEEHEEHEFEGGEGGESGERGENHGDGDRDEH